MANPSENTIQHLNVPALNSKIVWPAYLGQAFGVIPFVGFDKATNSFLTNEVMNNLASLSPYSRGTPLSGSPVNTSLVTENFSSFGDITTLPLTDIITSNTSCGTSQLEEQAKSIVVRIFRELMNQFFNGDGTGNNLNNIGNRADTTINAGGGSLQLSHLAQLRYSVKPSTKTGLGGGGNVWFSNEVGFRVFLKLLGRGVVKVKWKYLDCLGVKVAEYLGALWCVDDNIQTSGGATKIYFVNLDHLRILYAKSNEYPTSEKGIMSIPVPLQASVAELGMMILGVFAIQNDPFAIGCVENFKASP